MTKKHRPVSPARIVRRQAEDAKRQRREQITAVIIIVFMIVVVLVSYGIQLSHHM